MLLKIQVSPRVMTVGNQLMTMPQVWEMAIKQFSATQDLTINYKKKMTFEKL